MKKRVNISISEDVLESMDKICGDWGINRSEFIVFLFLLYVHLSNNVHIRIEEEKQNEQKPQLSN